MAIMFSAIFDKRFEETVGLGVITEMLLLFAGGHLGHLPIVAIAVLVISVIAMIVSLCVCLSAAAFKKLAINTFSLGFVAFILLLLLIYKMTEGLTLESAGSLGPVADSIRFMVENEDFTRVGVSQVTGIGYQPGYALFGYLFTALNGSFNEVDILRGANVFAAAMIMPLMNRMRWKNIYIGIFMIPAVYLIPWVVSGQLPVFNSLNADAAAALVFGFLLVTYMCCEQSAYVYWTLGLGSAALCLIRPGSELLAGLMFLIVVLDIAGIGFFETKNVFEKGGRWISIVAYAALTAGAFVSWWIYAYGHNIVRFFDCVYLTDARKEAFSGILKQITARASVPGPVGITPILWMVIFAVLGGAAAALSEGFWNRIRAGIQTLVVILGFVAFLYLLAFVYTYIMPSGTEIGAQADMFIAGYILAGILFAINFVTDKIMDRFRLFGKFLVLIFLVSLIFAAPVKEAYAVMFGNVLSAGGFSLHYHI